MPAAERQQETGTDVGRPLRRPCRITGRIRADARTREGADAGQVSLYGNTDNGTGTEGQVGRHDIGADGDAACCWRRGERTGGRTPRLGRDRLADRRGRRTAFTAADLYGKQGRGPQTGSQFAEVNAPVTRQYASQRAAGHRTQRWPQDSGRRRQGGVTPRGQGRTGRLGATQHRTVAGPAGQAGCLLYTSPSPRDG